MQQKEKKHIKQFLEAGGQIQFCSPGYAWGSTSGISRRQLPIRISNIPGSGEGCYWTKSPMVKSFR